MSNSLRTSAVTLALLCVPAALASAWSAVDAGRGDFFLAPQNALYFGAPHLLVAAVAVFWRRARGAPTLWVLVGLNLLLAAFQAWVLWGDVPAREGALAWVLYPLLAPIVLGHLTTLALQWRRGRAAAPLQMER